MTFAGSFFFGGLEQKKKGVREAMAGLRMASACLSFRFDFSRLFMDEYFAYKGSNATRSLMTLVNHSVHTSDGDSYRHRFYCCVSLKLESVSYRQFLGVVLSM